MRSSSPPFPLLAARRFVAAAATVALVFSSVGHAQTLATTDAETSMHVYSTEGHVDLCLTRDCDPSSRSLSLSPSYLLNDTVIDYMTNEVTSSTRIADFAATRLSDANGDSAPGTLVSAPEYNASDATTRAVMYTQSCFSGDCAPRVTSATAFVNTRATTNSDAIGMKLEYVHHTHSSMLPTAFESYALPSGAMTVAMNLTFVPPTGGPSTLTDFAVSFWILATEPNGFPSTNVSISSNNMYMKRIHVGPDLYLDLPLYAKVDSYDRMIEHAAKGYTSGELQDLIEVTLHFGLVMSSIGYTFAVASETQLASTSSVSSTPLSGSPEPSTDTPTPTPTTTPVPTTTTTTPAPTPALPTEDANVPRMVVGTRGEFALCGESNCSSSGVVSMGFSGLKTSAVDVKRFSNSPAFVFGAPQRVQLSSGGEMISSSFSVSVPQSRFRPLRPFTGGSSSDPTFTATLDQYTSAAQVSYGNADVLVPPGGLKYSINISQWQFASMNEQMQLNMSLHLLDGTNNSASTPSIDLPAPSWTNYGELTVLTVSSTKQLELPTFAIVDGVATPITITFHAEKSVASQATIGYIVSFTFPAFTSSLYYDPVLVSRSENSSSTTPQPTPTPTSTPAPTPREKAKRKIDSWVAPGILLGLLTLCVVVTVIHCTKKVKVKLDFSKIMP